MKYIRTHFHSEHCISHFFEQFKLAGVNYNMRLSYRNDQIASIFWGDIDLFSIEWANYILIKGFSLADRKGPIYYHNSQPPLIKMHVVVANKYFPAQLVLGEQKLLGTKKWDALLRPMRDCF